MIEASAHFVCERVKLHTHPPQREMEEREFPRAPGLYLTFLCNSSP